MQRTLVITCVKQEGACLPAQYDGGPNGRRSRGKQTRLVSTLFTSHFPSRNRFHFHNSQASDFQAQVAAILLSVFHICLVNICESVEVRDTRQPWQATAQVALMLQVVVTAQSMETDEPMTTAQQTLTPRATPIPSSSASPSPHLTCRRSNSTITAKRCMGLSSRRGLSSTESFHMHRHVSSTGFSSITLGLLLLLVQAADPGQIGPYD